METDRDIWFYVEEKNPVYLMFSYVSPISRVGSASEIEIIIAWALLFLVSAAFYIHLDITPFLPFQFSPETADIVRFFSFVGLGVSLLLLFGFLLLVLYESLTIYVRRVIRGPGCIVCAKCGNCAPLLKYMKIDKEKSKVLVHGCNKCGSMRVYCAKCGKSAHVKYFLEGDGCPHCGYPSPMMKSY